MESLVARQMGGHAGHGMASFDAYYNGYWILVGSVIALAAAANLTNLFIYRHRLAAVASKNPAPAAPRNAFARLYAGLVAVVREAVNASPSEFSLASLRDFSLSCLKRPKPAGTATAGAASPKRRPLWNYPLRLPAAGALILVLGNVVVLLILCFDSLSPSDRWSFEALAMRAGHVSLNQLPLIVLFAGRNNLVGLVVGSSHERLQWIHRWFSRCLWITATIHFSYWLRDWSPYGDFTARKFRNDPLAQRGLIAWSLLTWIILSSSAPIRCRGHELFVVQHVASFIVLLYFLYHHIPESTRKFIWITIAFACFDRLVRMLRILYLNTALFHKSDSPKNGAKTPISHALLSCHASFTPLDNGHTRITIRNPPIKSWRPGQHLFLSCPTLAFLQAHPFTISSLPADGKLDFIVKAHSGATKSFFSHAQTAVERCRSEEDPQPLLPTRAVAIEGPYGSMRPAEQFDSVLLFAGATGATFCIPILRDVVARWKSMHLPPKEGDSQVRLAATKRLKLVWAVKSRQQLSWFCRQLYDCLEVVEEINLLPDGPKLDLSVTIYMTCDDAFVGEHRSFLSQVAAAAATTTTATAATTAAAKPSASTTQTASPYLTKNDPSGGDDDATGFPEEAKCCCREGAGENEAGKQVECNCAAAGVNCGGEPEPAVAPGPGRPRTATASSTESVSNPLLSAQTSRDATTSGPASTVQAKSSRSDRNWSCQVGSVRDVHPSLRVIIGRPLPRDIIKRVVGHADGEVAVIACGPSGMITDVRAATVQVSDEFACSRSTGVQGMWFHAEGFGY